MKNLEKGIEKYIKDLKEFLKKNSKKGKINLGNPNDKHLRTYIKNIYHIKLLFPKTLNIELSHNKKEISKLINEYEKNKNKVLKRARHKLKKTPKFVIR